MKNIKKLFLVTVLAVVFTVLFSGCNKKSTLNGVSFLEDTITIEKFETYTLNLVGAEDKEITWKSADENKATVVDGVVYAKQKGSTKVSAYIGNASISCDVIISDNQYVPLIELDESEEGINLMENQSYVLSPTLFYNGNAYTDVEYSYSAVGETIAVDDSGKITSKGLGSGTICVKGLWRDNVIETSVAVNVIDVSTSIEVGSKHYEIYLNGYDEYPEKKDIGITVFDKDVQIENPEASVKYVEKTYDGDTSGAATIKNGVAYPKELGTTHFVAEYTSKSGETFSSATFSVTVKQTPADIYMTPIEGEEFEFFFEPLGAENLVVWDEELQAYHLINNVSGLNDARGFIINREYLSNIIKYTKAESIAFEYMTDGEATGADTLDKSIYQAFYPEWFTKDEYQILSASEKWTKIEIPFDSIPKDENGNYKTIFWLNTTQGTYIRNIKLYLPGEDRTNYDPNHNYLEDIKGKKYEFFIESLSDENSVVWDKKNKAYHLINKVSGLNDTRGFIFNKDYLTNIVNHTAAETISFEVKWDGKSTKCDTLDKGIYQGFYPNWFDADHMQRFELSDDWTKVTISLNSIPKDESGNLKTVFLMNTVGGMYIRNIKINLPIKWKKLGEISLDKYNLTWTHGDATGLLGGNDKGTVSYTDGVWKLADCYAFSMHELTFADTTKRYTDDMKVRIRIKATPNGTKMTNLKLNLYNYDDEGEIRYAQALQVEVAAQGKWITIEFPIEQFLNAKKQFKGFGFMTGGYNDWTSGEQYTIEFDTIEIWGPKGTKITTVPEEPKPEYEVIGEMSLGKAELAWTHGDETGLLGGNDIGTLSYADGVWKLADCYAFSMHEITFSDTEKRFTDDMKVRIRIKATPNGTDMANLKLNLYNHDAQGEIRYADAVPVEVIEQGKWTTVEFDIAPFLNAEKQFVGFGFMTGGYNDWSSGEKYTIEFDKIEILGLPGAEITEVEKEPEPEYGVIGEINFGQSDITWTHGEVTGISGCNNVGTLSYADGVWKLDGCYRFSAHEMTFSDTTKRFTDNMKVRIQIKATPNGSDMSNLKLILFNYDTAGTISASENVSVEILEQEEWTTVEFDIAPFLNAEKQFKGLCFVTNGYNNWDSGEKYTIELGKIEILGLPGDEITEVEQEEPIEPEDPVEPEEPDDRVWEAYSDKIYFNTENVAYTNNTLSNLHNSVNTVYTTDDKIYCKSTISGASFYGRKFVLNTPITDVTSDMKLRMKVYVRANSSTMAQADFKLYHVDYTGDANSADDYIAQSVAHDTWTEIEFNLAKLIDSDGTFRGFQFGNFDDATVEYYFNWVEIWRVQQETGETEEPAEDEWEVHGERIQFNTTNFALANPSVGDGTAFHSLVSVAETTSDGDALYLAAAENAVANNWLFFGKKFTLNAPLADLTSDMKLRMRLYVSGDDTTQANFRLYNVDYADNANDANSYIAPEVTHGTWTEIEMELDQFLDSDGIFRGFQLGNFDAATTMYYLNWIEIVKRVQ